MSRARSISKLDSPMLERYSLAVRSTAPKIANETPGTFVEGYWIDANRFYFLAERFDLSMGRILSVPSIADSIDNSTKEVIGLEALAALVSEKSGQTIDLMDLSSADFDMPNPDTLAVSVAGWDYNINLNDQRATTVRASLDVRALYSPDGRYGCFVNGHDIWLKEIGTEINRPLTSDGTAFLCYGQEPETSLATVTYRRRKYPVGLWSPDSKWFLTHQIDERVVPDSALIQNSPPEGGRPILHSFKRAMPGDPVPIGTYVAIHIASGRVVRFDDYPVVVGSSSPFNKRLAWFGAADTAWFMRFDRYWKRAELIELDLSHGTARIALSETTSKGYLELNTLGDGTPNVRCLERSGEIIWFSERDGQGHLYLYDARTGILKNRITNGLWVVRDIVHVDEALRKILFLASGIDPSADPARRSLCRVGFDGGGFEVLLNCDGDIFIPITEPRGLDQSRPFQPSNGQPGISPGGRFGVVLFSSVDRGNRTEIVDLESRESFIIASAVPSPGAVTPRHFTALAADGKTQLHGLMFLPPDFDERRHYPLIDWLYPGPQISWQPQSFGLMRSAPAMALAELGFITIMVDTRGMSFGNRAFHQAGYPQLHEPQLADHAAVVRQLSERHTFIDGDRVGSIGMSGGGFATARALFDYGEIFAVGVAVCGNHDSTFYGSPWSDKYRGAGDRASWDQESNGAAAHKLKGKLLLVSGDMDENVPVSQTFALADALVRANKDFDLLIVPNEGHSMLLSNGYAQRRVWDYFVRHLLGKVPPPQFEIKFEPHELARFAKCFRSEFRH